MALTSTTLSGGISRTQTQIVVASATNIVPGVTLMCESEFMRVAGQNPSALTQLTVLRGQQGTQAVAHNTTAQVVTGLPTDFAETGGPAPEIFTYGAAGALVVMEGLHELNSGAASAMTIVNPTTAQEGMTLIVVAKTAHAYTVAAASAFQGADTGVTATFGGAIGDSFTFTAVNGRWVTRALANVSIA